MSLKDPYQIIQRQYVTEKAMMLRNLQTAESNRSLQRCTSPKYVFIVHPTANKHQIKAAIEEIYKDREIEVQAVNTVRLKGKKRRVRGRVGRRSELKKAIVTLRAGDQLEENV